MRETITREICDFVADTEYHLIPEMAVTRAKNAILDMIGAALAGAQESSSKIVMEYARKMGGTKESSTIGKTLKTSAPLAALINGTSGHALDYDDASYTTLGHPTVAILPGILALAEKHGLPGKSVVLAYILGFEVAAKIGLGLGFDVYETGWHCTSTIGVIGAAAASAKILRLSSNKIGTSLGIAASLSCGLRQNFGTMTKPLHAGVAAHNGVMSALLAHEGFSSDMNILDAPFGYGHVYSREFDSTKISRALQGPLDILTNGLSFKPYPCCRFAHHLIDAALYLVHTHDIAPDEIWEIECRIDPIVTNVLVHHRPKDALEGKFSMEYCVARAVLDREVRLEHFTNASVANDEVRHFMRKIRYTSVTCQGGTKLGEGGTMPPAGIVIRLRNGDELTHTVDAPKGDPKNPMTTEELVEKFRNCASPVLPDPKIDRSVELLLRLESISDIRELMETIALA